MNTPGFIKAENSPSLQTSYFNETDLSPQPLTGRIIVLNEFPGTGKLTILKNVKEFLPVETTCLLDNHLLIDPVATVIPDRSDRHHELRRLVRAPIFEELRKRAQEGHTILMTACLAGDNERDAAFFQEHLDMARKGNVPIFWVNARCDYDVLKRRLISPERCQGPKTKLTDVNVLQRMVREHRLIEPCETDLDSGTLFVRTLDVSESVEESVSHLVDMVGLQQSINRTRRSIS